MPKIHIVFYQEKAGDAPWWTGSGNFDEPMPKLISNAGQRSSGFLFSAMNSGDPMQIFSVMASMNCGSIWGSINYRLLYFFHERTDSVVVHALTKENIVPIADINRAIARKAAFISNPLAHSFEGEIDDA